MDVPYRFMPSTVGWVGYVQSERHQSQIVTLRLHRELSDLSFHHKISDIAKLLKIRFRLVEHELACILKYAYIRISMVDGLT